MFHKTTGYSRFLLVMALMGCQVLSHSEVKSQNVQDARRAFEAGELYEARRITKSVLEKKPGDETAQKLMAQIIDQEIAREKEAFEPKAIEEFTKNEKLDEAKIWLDRSKTLLSIRQYGEALLAAEKVFLYDPENSEASRLIDEIKQKAHREGKSDLLFLKHNAEDEIRGRVETYRKQARQWVADGKWGAARLAVEKILLLVPEDKEALRLYEQIRTHKKLESL
ncbi:MAG: hypothetical protein HYZ84_02285 [Candidatus Omnitrophica bacterium]|nr:hypothetical protein [Candidatus Omnitrophota bacterium]